jgi:hypothetical protein
MATWPQLRLRFWVGSFAVCFLLVLWSGMPMLARPGEWRPAVGYFAFLGTLLSMCGLLAEGLFRAWRKWVRPLTTKSLD